MAALFGSVPEVEKEKLS